MTEAVVFDMDGVLFDSERLYARVWKSVGETLGLNDIDASIKYCIGRNGTDIQLYLKKKYGDSFDGDAFGMSLREQFRAIVNQEGLLLKPGVVDILRWLRQRNRKIALATSSGKNSAQQNLQGAGLTDYFDTIITGDMLTHGKPAPDIYLLACQALHTAPACCYAIEDSPNGILSAHAAGLKAILVPDFAEVPDNIRQLAYKIFTSLLEVKAYFESLP